MKESKIKLVSFKGFCELMEQPMCAKGRTHIREDYAVTLGVPNLFRSMLDDAPFARADCMRMGIAKEGFCNLVINGVSRRCLPGDLIYINWGGGTELRCFGGGHRLQGHGGAQGLSANHFRL